MVLLLIVAGCALLGGALLLALRQKPADGLETAVLAITLGVTLIGWVGVLLAELGAYSLAALGGSWLLLLAGLAVWAWRQRSRPWRLPESLAVPEPWLPFGAGWLEQSLLVLWLVTAVGLFLRPHEFLFGAADAGVYINLGAAIAQEGSILQTDPLLAELDPAFYPAFLRPLDDATAPYYLLPAFFVQGKLPGQLTPQFYPGHPVWLAIAYSLSGGQAAAMLLLPGLWALLAALVLYLLGRRLAGWQTAVLLLAAFTLNALQVWFARYPTAESLSQYLLLAGVWCLGQWISDDDPLPLWGLAGGLALGQLFLVRIDAIIIMPALLGLAVWQLAAPRRRSWQLAWFWLPLTLALLHAVGHGLWQSEPYFWSIFGVLRLALVRNWEPLLLAGLVVVVVAWLLGRRFGLALPLLWQRRLLGAAAVGLLLWAAYGWFVRPYVNETVLWTDPYSTAPIPLLNHENWLRLGWYLTAVGVWLGVLGTGLLLWRWRRQTAVFVAVGLLFALVYLTNSRANPHQIYVMRRYVPAVVPLFTVAAAYLLYELARWKRPFSLLLAGLLALVWLGGLGWAARGFVTQVDYAGVTAQLDAFNEQFEPHSLLLFNDQAAVGPADVVGTPLKFLYGHDVLILRDPTALSAEQLRGLLVGWRENGRFVYWLGDPTWLDEQGIGYTTSSATISSQRLEGSYEAKPQQILPLQLQFEIARLQ